ncbi:MAG: hypothetical protein R2941_20445 [Desulfobacterales bacterium]
MTPEEKIKTEQDAARKLIYEMMDAALELSVRKGPHPLEKGCNCIACVNKRKAVLRGKEKEWKYRL